MLLIKNGRVVDPVTNTDRKLDVLVDGAVITEVEQQIDLEVCREKYGTDDVRVIDAEGLVVAPGLVDTHVHFRDPGFTYKEDIETEQRLPLMADLRRLSVWQIRSRQLIM